MIEIIDQNFKDDIIEKLSNNANLNRNKRYILIIIILFMTYSKDYTNQKHSTGSRIF